MRLALKRFCRRLAVLPGVSLRPKFGSCVRGALTNLFPGNADVWLASPLWWTLQSSSQPGLGSEQIWLSIDVPLIDNFVCVVEGWVAVTMSAAQHLVQVQWI